MPATTELRFAEALEKIAGAVALQAETNSRLCDTMESLSRNMKRMTSTIGGAQRKIGGEIEPLVAQSIEMNRKIAEELGRVAPTDG